MLINVDGKGKKENDPEANTAVIVVAVKMDAKISGCKVKEKQDICIA